MRLLPAGTFVRPHHRIPLTTIEEDVSNEVSKEVDLVTGAISVQKNSQVRDMRKGHFKVSMSLLEGREQDNKEVLDDEKIRQAHMYAIHLRKEKIREYFTT